MRRAELADSLSTLRLFITSKEIMNRLAGRKEGGSEEILAASNAAFYYYANANKNEKELIMRFE